MPKKYILKEDKVDPFHENDIEVIQNYFLKMGMEISARTAEIIWQSHSNNYAASWLYVTEGELGRAVGQMADKLVIASDI